MEIVPKHEGTRGFVYVHVHTVTTCFSMVREFIPYIHWTFTHVLSIVLIYKITLVSHTCTCIVTTVKEIIKFRELSQLL